MYDRGLWRYIRFFENPVDFINSPVYRDGCEFPVIFPENPVGLAGMLLLQLQLQLQEVCTLYLIWSNNSALVGCSEVSFSSHCNFLSA